MRQDLQDYLVNPDNQDAILDEMEEFLTGVRHRVEPDTVLATVLVAEIADGGMELLRRLHAYIAKEIEWFRGREIDIDGNRLLAIFDGPARAVRCASTITQYASRLGVAIRAGLHTGEREIVDGKVAGDAGRCVCAWPMRQSPPRYSFRAL